MRWIIALSIVVGVAIGGVALTGSDDAGGSAVSDLAASLPPLDDPDSLSARVIGESDLPPDGTRSLFDHLVAANGALPYPFTDIIDWLATLDAQGDAPTTVLIPHGRSLQKGKSSFADPRVVLTADIQPATGAATAPIYTGRLFLGFVSGANEIEVLSYNEAAGRYEFQLVQDYCEGCTPRIVYAKRAVCRTCHQNASAIFPVRPWDETNAQTAIADRIAEQHPSRTAHDGSPIRVPLANPETIDNNTDIANMIPVAQRIWLDGCGVGDTGSACRREMLRQALSFAMNPGGFEPDAPAVQQLVSLRADSYPERGFELPDNDLNNRNPLQDDLYQGGTLAALKRAVFGRSETTTAAGESKLQAFDALPPLPPEFDPLTRRPPVRWIGAADLDGVYALAQQFAPSDIDRLIDQAGGDITAVLAAVDDNALDTHVGEVPFRRTAITNALLTALGATTLPAHWGMNVADMSPPIAEGEPPLELAAGSPLQPFETYCFACHRGNPNAKLNFMAGATEAEVLANIEATESIRDALDYDRYTGTRKASQLMPPDGTWQRDRLEKRLATGDDPLTAMREQVPSMFDF